MSLFNITGNLFQYRTSSHRNVTKSIAVSYYMVKMYA